MADATASIPGYPLVQQAAAGDTEIEYSAADIRTLLGAMWNTTGVLRTGDLAMSQRSAGANWSIDIAPGYAVVPGTETHEPYVVHLDSTLNVNLSGLNTAPAAPRMHKVYVAVYDKLYVGTGYEATVYVAEDTGSGAGTPSGSPVGYVYLGAVHISPAQASIQDANIQNLPEVAGFSQPWEELTLYSAGGMAAYDAARPPSWRKIGDRVELRGIIKDTNPPIAQNGQLFTLPSIAAPTGSVRLPAAMGTGSDGQVRTAVVLIATSGIATVVYTPGPGALSPNLVSLDGCWFDLG